MMTFFLQPENRTSAGFRAHPVSQWHDGIWTGGQKPDTTLTV